LIVAALACTTTPGPTGTAPRRAIGPAPELDHTRLALEEVRVETEPITVEQSWILRLYTRLHAQDYRSYRVEFPSQAGGSAMAHLLLPPGNGPHATVVVFPILAGSHIVSEGLAKALVNRGLAVARLERKKLDFAENVDPEAPAHVLRSALYDARRLLDWLVTRPEVDPDRLGTAGVSLGGILASTLLGVDARVRAGVFLMAGGGIADILHDSTEKPIRAFRKALREERGLEEREAFVAELQPFTEPVDPLSYAQWIDPRSVLLVSGRFDRVIPPERTRALWEALRRPTWIRLPVGHYQFFPFFWWAVGRGADHLERALAPVDVEAETFGDLHHSKRRSAGRFGSLPAKSGAQGHSGLQKVRVLSE
jgi:dienelactone hydrolase